MQGYTHIQFYLLLPDRIADETQRLMEKHKALGGNGLD